MGARVCTRWWRRQPECALVGGRTCVCAHDLPISRIELRALADWSALVEVRDQCAACAVTVRAMPLSIGVCVLADIPGAGTWTWT